MTVDTKKFQELLLATEVASPDRDDGPHMRRQYDDRRAALIAYLGAELAAARVQGLLDAAALAEECVTGLGAAGQIRTLAAQAAGNVAVQSESSLPVQERRPESDKLCYCLGGPNNHQSGCTEGHPSDLPDYAPAAAPTPMAPPATSLDAGHSASRAAGLEDAVRLCEARAMHWQQQEGSYAAGKKAGALDAAEQIRGVLTALQADTARVIDVQQGHAFFAPPGTVVRHADAPSADIEGERARFAADFATLDPRASYGVVEVAWATNLGKMWRMARTNRPMAASSAGQPRRVNKTRN
jgi:hypothetical protein